MNTLEFNGNDYSIKLSPEAAACGNMAAQYSLDGFEFKHALVDPLRPFTSHQVELWENKISHNKLVVKKVKKGLEATLVADIIGQRFFTLLNLPTPQTSLIFYKNQVCLVMEYLHDYNFSEVLQFLPSGYKNNLTLQSGILADIWLNHSDRQPYNIMYREGKIVFIDFGGCLTSTPSGKVKGMNPIIDEKEIYQALKAFQGDYQVNDAYAAVIKLNIKNKTIKILNSALVKLLCRQLASVTDAHIDAIISQNTLDFQNKNLARIRAIIDNAENDLKIPIEKLHYAHYHNNFKEALRTYTLIKNNFDSNEVAYFKYALKKRRDSLVKFLS